MPAPSRTAISYRPSFVLVANAIDARNSSTIRHVAADSTLLRECPNSRLIGHSEAVAEIQTSPPGHANYYNCRGPAFELPSPLRLSPRLP